MHQGGHGQEMEPGEVPGDEAGVAGVVSQTQTAMAEAGAEGLTWTDGQAAAVGETVSYQVRLLKMKFENFLSIQCPLGFATLGKAAALALATSRALTDLRQYINSDLGFSDLEI